MLKEARLTAPFSSVIEALSEALIIGFIYIVSLMLAWGFGEVSHSEFEAIMLKYKS